MRSLLVGISVLASAAVACSAPIASPSSSDSFLRDAAEGASSAALIVFERTATGDESAHGSAVARFIRMRAGLVDDQTLRMVGATLDLPALGSCAATSVTDDALGADGAPVDSDGPRAVELLDVGTVTVESAGARASLEARALPDIVDLVTGVLYSSRTAFDTDGLPARGAYVLRSSGSAARSDVERGVPAFTVPATAPGAPDELRVDGQDAKGADGLVLTAGARSEVAWSVGDANDPDDVVYIDVVSATDARPSEAAATMRCAFADHGSATLPASAFGPSGSEIARGTMVVHRLHSETFRVPGDPVSGRTGIEAGVVRFDFARAAEFTRR
jgi:hypothetical protein